MSAPLTRPSTRLCPGCDRHRPHGHFTERVSLDTDPQRWRLNQYHHCRGCRSGSTAAPGRAFR